MKSVCTVGKLSGIAAVFSVLLLASGPASAHCDGADGPVAHAAHQALDSGNPNLVLAWVQKDDEAAIKAAFQETLEVRKLNPAAKEMADRYFLETLVRVHRAGEGAPYTGIKPAGRDLGPAVPAGDRAIETKSVEPLLAILTQEVQKNVRQQFEKVVALRNYDRNDVAAGQQYVKAYVEYIHTVEGIFDAAKGAGHGQHAAEDSAPATAIKTAAASHESEASKHDHAAAKSSAAQTEKAATPHKHAH